MFLGQAGIFLSFQARRSSATRSSTSDLTVLPYLRPSKHENCHQDAIKRNIKPKYQQQTIFLDTLRNSKKNWRVLASLCTKTAEMCFLKTFTNFGRCYGNQGWAEVVEKVFVLQISSYKAGPFVWILAILTCLHHGIDEMERHLLWKFHNIIQRKSWSNEPPNLLACIRFLYKVVQNIGRLRKFDRTQEIEFSFFTIRTVCMKFGTLVHHVDDYEVLPQIFYFLPRVLVMVFQSQKMG